jgi:nucleoside 2-deoxyribosyltransferase
MHARSGLDPAVDPVAAAAAAATDLQELSAADAFVAITEGADAPKFGRGGRQVEFGAALALGKRMLVIGPVEHVFHVAHGVRVCADWTQATEILVAWAADNR